MKTLGHVKQSAFFRVMVVMGSSVVVGCGGTTRDEGMGNSGDGATGSGARPSAMASGGAGGTTHGSGGSIVVAPPVSGGSAGTPPVSTVGAGGSVSIPDAGLGAGGSALPGIFGPPPTLGDAGAAVAAMRCPSQQWECDPDSLRCDLDIVGYQFAVGNCSCNPSGPLRPADCPQGDVLVCQAYVRGPEGGTAPFNCLCVPAGASCESTCETLGSTHRAQPFGGCIADNGDNYLCGCAVVSLK